MICSKKTNHYFGYHIMLRKSGKNLVLSNLKPRMNPLRDSDSGKKKGEFLAEKIPHAVLTNSMCT